MRRATIALIGCLGLLLSLLAVPAEASWDWGKKVPQATTTVTTPGHGVAMGGQPNWWTICVANGYGPTAGLVSNWNWPGRQLDVNVQNRCDGYSITNRMTIDNVSNYGACIQYSNLGHTTYKYQHGGTGAYYYIWNQNPVIWINTASHCHRDNVQLYHNIQKGVGYILGLAYGTCDLCIMGPDTNNTPYVTNGDSLDTNVIYQL